MKKLEPPPKGKATIEEYRELLEDRPRKFTPEQVGYKPAEGDENCGNCLHFYEGRLHTVCEIMRAESEQVNPLWICKFWTQDPEFEEHPFQS